LWPLKVAILLALLFFGSSPSDSRIARSDIHQALVAVRDEAESISGKELALLRDAPEGECVKRCSAGDEALF
jgi:hypothetical protein